MLFIVFDTARASAFEPYGARPGASPAVRDLAARGEVHPAAVATSCWTVPSHASMFSGLPYRAAGFDHIGGGAPAEFAAAVAQNQDRWLPSFLQRQGYATAGVSTNLWVSEQTAFDTGFDTFRYVPSPRSPHLQAHTFREHAHWLIDALRATADDGAAQVEGLLAEWVAQQPRRPFFWFVNLVECHSPYLPPKPYNPLGPLGRLRAARDAGRYLHFDAIWRNTTGGFDLEGPAIERLRTLYAAAIVQLDAWLARVLELLDGHGLLEGTEIVLCSDHGENLGEGDLIGHSFSLDDRLLRVPMLTAGPLPAPGGDLFSLSRLPGWLASGLGFEDHPWQADAHHRVATAEFDAPGPGNEAKAREAAAKWGLGEDCYRTLMTSYTMATDGRWKLFRRPEGLAVIDTVTDPVEVRPRPMDQAVTEEMGGALLAELTAALDDLAERAVPPAHKNPQATPVDRTVAGAGVGHDDEAAALEAQMRLLGYL